MATRTRRAAHAETEPVPVDEDLEGSDGEAAAAAGEAAADPLQADDPWAFAAGQADGGDQPLAAATPSRGELFIGWAISWTSATHGRS